MTPNLLLLCIRRSSAPCVARNARSDRGVGALAQQRETRGAEHRAFKYLFCSSECLLPGAAVPQAEDLLGAVGAHAQRDVDGLVADHALVTHLDPQGVEEHDRVDPAAGPARQRPPPEPRRSPR